MKFLLTAGALLLLGLSARMPAVSTHAQRPAELKAAASTLLADQGGDDDDDDDDEDDEEDFA